MELISRRERLRTLGRVFQDYGRARLHGDAAVMTVAREALLALLTAPRN